MKFPFVSRDRYEEAVATRNATISHLEGQLEHERRLHREAVNELVKSYRHKGIYSEFEPVPAAASAPQDEEQDPMKKEVPSEVEQARAAAGGSTRGALRILQRKLDKDYAQERTMAETLNKLVKPDSTGGEQAHG